MAAAATFVCAQTVRILVKFMIKINTTTCSLHINHLGAASVQNVITLAPDLMATKTLIINLQFVADIRHLAKRA